MSIFSADFSDVILWQYDRATNLKSLIQNKQEFYNQNVDKFFEDWYRDVFNLDTANYFGLIVWAIILGCTEYIEITQIIGQKAIGYGEHHKNFHESNFALSSYIYSLKPEQLRKVLKAQMYNFNSNGSLYDINKILTTVLPGHNAYATVDHTTNTIILHFPIPLDDDDMNIVLFSNMLPVPMGYKREIDNGTEAQ